MRKFDSPPIGSASWGDEGLMCPGYVDAVHYARDLPVEPRRNDPNKSSWASIKTLARYDSIDGFWSSRWCTWGTDTNASEPPPNPMRRKWLTKWQEGTALVKTVDEWVFVEY